MALDLTDVDLTSEVVRTERLLLRPPREDDVDAIVRACQDAESQRWLTSLPSPYTREDAIEFAPASPRVAGLRAPTSAARSRRMASSSARAGCTP